MVSAIIVAVCNGTFDLNLLRRPCNLHKFQPRKFHWCAGGLPLVAHGGRGHRPQLPAPGARSQCYTDHLIVIEITSVFTNVLIHLHTYFTPF